LQPEAARWHQQGWSTFRRRSAPKPVNYSTPIYTEATNTGFEPLVRLDVPALRRSRLSRVKQNFLRAETLTSANAALVAAQNGIKLAQSWVAARWRRPMACVSWCR
jgi:hypothetical protein